jgi:AraC-like DNA-binding protein
MKARYVLGGYTEWTVPPGIARVVEASWTYTGAGSENAAAPTEHRVLPHVGVSLVVHGRRNGAGYFRPAGLQLQGAAESYRFFRPTSGLSLAAVRLRPEWVRAVLGVDAGELKDRIVAVEETPAWRAVYDLVREAGRLHVARAWLEAFVHDRLGTVRADAAGITAHRALEHLRVDPSSGRVSTLARAAGVSERTLHRSVTSATGMSPKWIQRVERLTRAVTAADGLRRPRWSDMAFRFGYADQAHLVREARALTGCTPKTLHRERRVQRRLEQRSASSA